MKLKYIIIVVSIFFLISCNKNQQKEMTPEEILVQTPEVLNDNSSDFDMSSGFKRYDYQDDIIAKLYNEALEKNTALKLLDESIQNINNDSLNDNTEEYLKYIRINSEYWATANGYIGNFNDSLLKQETLTLFETLETNYKESIAKHKAKLEKIRERTTALNERLILMKLMVSQTMINNYQTNEKPDIQELEILLKQYDDLILKTDQFTKIVK